MDIYLLLWLVLFTAPVSTMLHELGHVLGAKWAKADSITLSVGAGKKLITFSFKQIQIDVFTLFFLGGSAYSERNIPYKPMEKICISLAGPVSNGLAAAIVCVLFGSSNVFVQVLILFNIWLAVINIIPFKLNGKQSDGYTIVKTVSQTYTNFK
ncbi:hypothetical protein F3157_04880 [Virgibacillus dakarensis]|uniref:Peptidase M50 domain-containing protein n=1 Tax=Lentibacillus populi TaxID=1827502 RepID=A0A9W5X4G2_9BACI|nr:MULTISPECIES: M50 family metallopeptidase [Bacillaceae]MBT2214316.1 M50 family metallopeptidase [Virgibacillus dakarensis]MTW84993.1 hypothetical protein [Virgibacillus dakarensis]GGB33889.1 hypothetical protein GCM10011409_09140 [Lentibacillus populi]